MTFEELSKDELSIVLNNSDTSVLYTGARRRKAINDACEEFADLTECTLQQWSVVCSCNVTENTLTAINYIRIAKQGVEYVHTSSNGFVTQASGDDFPRRDLVWRNRFDVGWRASTTPVLVPSGYYLREDSSAVFIGLNEPPKIGSSETGTLIVPLVMQPTAMTSSGEVPFSSRVDLKPYHKALPFYAGYKLLGLTGDDQGAQASLQKFLGYVARYTQNTRPKGGQHVTVGRSYLRESMRRTRGDGDVPGFVRP